jgi:UDP-N-acetyl-D-glucosamine dehydrogenase
MTQTSHDDAAGRELQHKIDTRTARVGVVGLGYVGLPLVRAFHEAGFATLGFDVDPKKVAALAAGRSYLKHLDDGFVSDMAGSGRFEATSDFSRLGEADAVLICVPTPLGSHREADLTYVQRAAEAAAATLRRGQLIVLESSTYPGTTREVVLPPLEKAGQPAGAQGGLKCGRDFFVAFSPEREDPGRKDFNTQTIPKLVGGMDAASGDLAQALYQCAIRQVVRVSSCEVAEAAKLLENIYRAVNIAMVNEMKVVLTAMGVDIWEVVDAAATKPFGFQPFYPGPGLGGHCIPIDPFYLTWKARELGLPTRFIELAGEVNHAMPTYVVQRVAEALNSVGKAVKGARVLVLGLAYKPDVDDVRESPSFELITRLGALGAAVDYHDPHVPATHPMRHYPGLAMTSIELTDAALASYDAVLIATHHSAYDWQRIAERAKLVIDTRGVTRRVTGRRDLIVQA